MRNSLFRFLMNLLGFMLIYSVMSNPGFKEFICVTIGGLLLSMSTQLFPPENDDWV